LGYRIPVDGRLAALVNACGLGLGDPLKLPFSPQVGLEFREHPQHIKEAFPGRSAGIDRLLRGLQGCAFGLESPNNVLQVTDAPGKPIDPGDH
jgi:hypothetical protein